MADIFVTRQKILVSDFDGTITDKDFFELAVTHLLRREDLRAWDEFLAGDIDHFTALQRIYGQIRAPEEAVVALLEKAGADPLLLASVEKLAQSGWEVVVASAGCEWYVRRILDDMGVCLAVHASPGEYAPGGPLVVKAPVDSPFYNPAVGVDKAALVRSFQAKGYLVAYAGDGMMDAPASLLVSADVRFARENSSLAYILEEQGEGYRSFTRWSAVADALLAKELARDQDDSSGQAALSGKTIQGGRA
ncbi:haloacid dehalogenase-like hydrolase [Desulfovibrio sp. OttesenSCG-928-G15]|nr:haloacid dehalogenase-like hydrolase [Desulfovibrio sp. OttesenSCG-928-G15]